MRVLIACEYSGVVREAFRAKGHDAYSCDLLPAEDGSPYHYQQDALVVASQNNWDLMIAHPPCTYLCNSSVWALHLPKETRHKDEEFWSKPDHDSARKVAERWKELKKATEFFMMLWNAPIPRICVENPIPHRYAELPEYSQTIQPYQFGDDASKRTCLWLKGLPKLLIPSEEFWVQPRIVSSSTGSLLKRWSNQTDSGQNKLGPSDERAKERSRTYQGIAKAFADQWG